MDTALGRNSNVSNFSGAYYLLEGLKEIGIDYLFCNLGTDHAPIIEEMAHRRKRGEVLPDVVRCPHENTAAHMAGGYALVTGRGQGVLVHVDVGTANAANAMHNLYRSRLPVLLMAGKAPYTSHDELVGTRDTHVHFVQEPFDQGSLVRPYVKWEWTLPSGVVVKEALQRAYSIMQSAPRGPVYLMMQRETLTEHWRVDEIRRFPNDRFGALAGAGADPDLIAALADRILSAQNPVLITGYSGLDALGAQKIDELAQFAGIADLRGNSKSNVSYESPCFAGFTADEALPDADVGLLVDVEVPWFPGRSRAQRKVFLGPYRCRRSQERLADVDVPRPSAAAGIGRPHPRSASDGHEGQGDAALPRGRRVAARQARGGARSAQGAGRQARGRQGPVRCDQSALSDGGACQGARRSTTSFSTKR